MATLKPRLEQVLTAMREHQYTRNAADDRRSKQRIDSEFRQEQYERQLVLAKLFGKLNGWRLTKTSFELDDFDRFQRRHRRPLFRTYHFLDHPLYYRDSSCSCFAAIVAQPYGKLDEFRETLDDLAACYNLSWHVPPAAPNASIWYPGWTLFIVITRPDHNICWLPEQLKVPDLIKKKGPEGRTPLGLGDVEL
jgi:hypothetical protein